MVVKQFAASILILTGKSGYEFLQVNLGNALPSYPTVQRMISKKERVIEGTFYFDELLEHLKEWKAPLFVNLHLDDTRIKHRVEYDPVTDRYVGFVLPLKDGLPVCDFYIFETFEEIADAYSKCNVGKYAHVIVAKPLTVDAPTFILAVLGTDAKYDHTVILQRWGYIKKQLLERNIVVVSNGADGAGPFLKAMIEESNLFSISRSLNVPSTWTFYLMPDIPAGNFFSQDTVHLLAKLRTRILTPSNIIIIGGENAGVAHLQYLYDQLPKEQHGLSQQTIDNKDKQYYGSIATLVSEDLEMCLRQVSGKIRALGTIVYLHLMRSVRDANFDKTLSPLARVSLLWEVTFFLRIWRHWLQDNGYSETDHFITGNAYMCIELNSHMLVGVIFNVINTKLPKEALRIWTAGSQGCEQVFRLLRSMTPVFSTIINFSLKGILERIHKLNYLASIENCDDIIFPRVKRRLMQLNEESEVTFEVPTLDDLERCIRKTKEKAITLANQCGMVLQSYEDADIARDTTILVEDAISCDHEQQCSHPNIPSTDETEAPTQAEINVIKEDLSVIRLQKKRSTGFPTYSPSNEKGSVSKNSYSLTHHKKSPFVQYKGAYIRKTTALYILQENCQLSNDRLLRVRSDQPSHLFSGIDQQSTMDSSVRVGDLCIFRQVDSEKVLLGRAIQFSYLQGSKKEREYSSTYVDMTIDSHKNIGVFANYFARREEPEEEMQDVVQFQPLDLIFKAGYLPMDHYICTIDEKFINASDHEDITFEIDIHAMRNILPEWLDALSSSAEFITS